MATKKRLVYAREVEEIFNYVEQECSDSYQAFKVAIEKATTVDAVEVVHGRWLLEREPDGKPYCLHCSVCDGDFSNPGIMQGYDYCPNCGAKMDGGSDEIN